MTVNQIAHREYLKSATWQDIRKQILERDNYTCKCGNTAQDVHHKHYKRWGNEKLSDLISLCRTCHESLHQAKKGTKNNSSIGTRAILGYLNNKQKENIKNKFNFKYQFELENAIHYNPINEVCKYAANLLGHSNWYSQLPKHEQTRKGLRK